LLEIKLNYGLIYGFLNNVFFIKSDEEISMKIKVEIIQNSDLINHWFQMGGPFLKNTSKIQARILIGCNKNEF
jgi:hypothetical protein